MKVLKFYADWCGPCKMLSKIMEGMGDLNVEIVNIDVDNDQETAVKYGIRGVPTMIVIDDEGKEVRRKVGMMSEAELRVFIS